MSIELKIKAKSLAAEKRIIVTEEYRLRRRIAKHCANARKAGKPIYDGRYNTLLSMLHSLELHRLRVVCPAARETQLARAFLRGCAYRNVERTCRERNEPNRTEVRRLVERYGPRDFQSLPEVERKKRIDDWFTQPLA